MAAGPGYTDSDGIWRYGEDDALFPSSQFSELLNKLASTVGPAINTIVNQKVVSIAAAPDVALILATVASQLITYETSTSFTFADNSLPAGAPLKFIFFIGGAPSAPGGITTGLLIRVRRNSSGTQWGDVLIPFTTGEKIYRRNYAAGAWTAWAALT